MMNKFVLSLIALGFVGQAQAAGVKLEECVQEGQFSRGQQMSCIGLQQQACLEKRGSDSNMDMAECADEETKMWQSMMDDAQATLLANQEEPMKGQLLEIQKNWEAYVKGYCQYRMDRWGRGSGAISDGASCYLNATALRAIDLMEDDGWPAN